MPTKDDNLIRPDSIINEKSTAFVDISFFDDAGAPAVPGSAYFSLYDRATGAVINSRNQVSIGSLAASVSIELTPSDNPVLNQNKRQEEHVLYVTYFYGAGNSRKGSARIVLTVENELKEV